MTTVVRNPKVKAYTYKKDVPLKGGATLAFKPGVGYYAKPAAANPYAPPVRPNPTPPVNPLAATPADQIDQQATTAAQGVLTPQQDEVRRQQALARQNAEADYGAIRGLSTASAGLMAQLGPEAQAAYTKAAETEGTLGQGLATGVASDVAAGVSADKAFMESQGQQGGPGPDTAALHDTVYSLNGRIPGDSLAEQGANAAKWGLAQAPIALNAGREQLDARMATARQENDQYAQQLIQLAAQFPAEKAKALAQLNQYELDKANYRLNAKQTNANIAIQKRSLADQEKAAGLTAEKTKADIAYKNSYMNYKWASLRFQSQKEAARAQSATRKGKTIDTAASRLLGHIVYKDGSEDPSIKVAQSGSSTATANAKAASKARKTAFDYATKLLGTAVKAPAGSKGAYVARPGAKGSSIFKSPYPGVPATTNNPRYAQRTGGAANYADAQAKVWAEIDGDGLVAAGYSRTKVMAWVKQALAAAGWKRK